MPALNVVRFGVKPFASVWQRVYENSGVKMKAYVAIQRKLLVLIYTLYKKQEAFHVAVRRSESVAA
jgi:transposase